MNDLVPGGLAIVLKAHIGSNIGKCVTTERLLAPNEEIDTPDGGKLQNWRKQPMWYITGNIQTEFFSGRIGVGYGIAPAANLLPINPETVDEKELEEVA